MSGKMQQILLGGSIVFMILVLVNIGLFITNRSTQEQVANRNQYIQQSLQMEKLYQSLIRGLSELAANKNDAQLKSLLNDQGISFTVTPKK